MEKHIDLFIYGAGGLASEIKWIIERNPLYRFAGYIVTDQSMISSEKIVGDETWLLSQYNPHVIIGIGNPKVRMIIQDRIAAYCIFPSLIDTTAIVSPTAIISDGVVIAPNCVVSTNVIIHKNTYVNFGCTIGHDTVIGNCCLVNPGCNISGDVTIKDNVMIGTGSKIIEKLIIEHDSYITAGSIITRNVPAKTTMAAPAARKVSTC